MDKFKNTINEILKFFVISFTTCTIFWVIRAEIFNNELIPTIHFIYILGLSVIGAILERIFLSFKVLGQLSFKKRGFLFLFFICIIIFTFGRKIQLFPFSTKELIIRFIISYILGCSIMVLVDKYLTREGEKYTEMLNEYKKQNMER